MDKSFKISLLSQQKIEEVGAVLKRPRLYIQINFKKTHKDTSVPVSLNVGLLPEKNQYAHYIYEVY